MSAVAVRRLTAQDDLDAAQTLLIRFFSEEQFDTPEATIRLHSSSHER